MTKQEMLTSGYKYIATQNSKEKIEVWAKFTGFEDTITYLYYNPETNMTLEQSKSTISYLQLDLMAQIRDKMRADFLKQDITFDKECIWRDEERKR